IVTIAREMIARSGAVLVTRLDHDKAAALVEAVDGIDYYADAASRCAVPVSRRRARRTLRSFPPARPINRSRKKPRARSNSSAPRCAAFATSEFPAFTACSPNASGFAKHLQ